MSFALYALEAPLLYSIDELTPKAFTYDPDKRLRQFVYAYGPDRQLEPLARSTHELPLPDWHPIEPDSIDADVR